jgi:tRNA nucleotidyltransferase/poly(A) polymerase
MPSNRSSLVAHRLPIDSLRTVLMVRAEVRLENYALAKAKFEEYSAEHLRPEPLVTGADLIGMGYEPGPQFSQILAVLEDAQLEGRIVSQEEAMELVRARFPREEA